jgi:hypothetical protein
MKLFFGAAEEGCREGDGPFAHEARMGRCVQCYAYLEFAMHSPYSCVRSEGMSWKLALPEARAIGTQKSRLPISQQARIK